MINHNNSVEYILAQDKRYQSTLKNLQALILKACPQAQERMSYGVICYHYYYSLVGIGVTKKCCSFYIMDPTYAPQLKKDYPELKIKGTTIHLYDPLPKKIITQIVKNRMAMNLKKHQTKSKK